MKKLLMLLTVSSVFLFGCLGISDISECGNTLNMDERAKCVTSVAVNNEDSSVCRTLGEKESECIAEYEIQTESFECNNVKTDLAKEYCLANKAVSESNKDACNQIHDEIYKAYCIENTPAENNEKTH
ncbi:MAG: hypothetical protein ABH803_02080 [Candidatus Micrarchaeota archaeon]